MGPSWEQDCEDRGGTLLVEGIIIARRCSVCPSWEEVPCLTRRQNPFMRVVDSCWASRNYARFFSIYGHDCLFYSCLAWSPHCLITITQLDNSISVKGGGVVVLPPFHEHGFHEQFEFGTGRNGPGLLDLTRSGHSAKYKGTVELTCHLYLMAIQKLVY